MFCTVCGALLQESHPEHAPNVVERIPVCSTKCATGLEEWFAAINTPDPQYRLDLWSEQ